ncbi:MAG: NIPSNAP family protein [Acidobacteria bacterium]|nr:NIPSNAP family protein [Acidobacteriota bacterium]
MNRRDVLKTGFAAGIASAANIAAEGNHFYELRTYELRNDLQPARIQDFFQNHFMPMIKRLGIGPVGCFNVMSGLYTPSLIVVIDYKSLAEVQSTMERASSDRDFMKAWQSFEAAGELPYVRYESVLLKAFDAHQKFEVPPAEEKRPPRVFELRTYESKNAFSLRNKIEMFNQEEIKIFRDCGFATVFFGEAVFGTRLPHLTYLVGFDNMAAREKAWDAFRANPDWARVRNRSGWTDPEAVSNIHASFLRPTSYSQIR